MRIKRSKTRRTIRRDGDRGVARRLSGIRRELCISLIQVSHSFPCVRDYENGLIEVPAPELEGLSRLYGCSVSWLATGKKL